MPKPTPPDLNLYDQISTTVYWEAWDHYAQTALQSILTFHGACDSTAPSSAAQHAADCATELLNRRLEMMAAIKEAQIAAREVEKGATKAKPDAKR